MWVDVTCCDTVKGVWQQVIQSLALVYWWTTAVDVIQSGIGLMHPLYQPFELTVTYQVVTP